MYDMKFWLEPMVFTFGTKNFIHSNAFEQRSKIFNLFVLEAKKFPVCVSRYCRWHLFYFPFDVRVPLFFILYLLFLPFDVLLFYDLFNYWSFQFKRIVGKIRSHNMAILAPRVGWLTELIWIFRYFAHSIHLIRLGTQIFSPNGTYLLSYLVLHIPFCFT